MLQSCLHYHIMWGQQMNFLFFALNFLICFMLLEQIMKGLYLSSEKCPAVIFFFSKINSTLVYSAPKTERKGEYNVYVHIFWDNGRAVNQTPRYLDYRASMFQSDRNKAEKYFFEVELCDRRETHGYVMVWNMLRSWSNPVCITEL